MVLSYGMWSQTRPSNIRPKQAFQSINVPKTNALVIVRNQPINLYAKTFTYQQQTNLRVRLVFLKEFMLQKHLSSQQPPSHTIHQDLLKGKWNL